MIIKLFLWTETEPYGHSFGIKNQNKSIKICAMTALLSADRSWIFVWFLNQPMILT